MAHSTMPGAFQQGEDRLVQCPYNPAHHVREGRLDIHISSCRKGSRRALVNCRFNANHLVAADALHEHLASCPDRCSSGPASQSKDASASSEADALYPIRQVDLPEPEESWDEYREDAENRRPPTPEPVFRPVPIAAGPAARRAFHHDAMKASPRPAGKLWEHQLSGENRGPPPQQSSVKAAARNLEERAHPPQQGASSSRSLQPAQQPGQVGLKELPQPTTTIGFLPARLLPCPRPESDSEEDDDTVARRVASLGRGMRRRL